MKIDLFNEGSVEFKITFTTRCSAQCITCLNNTIKKHYDLDEELFKKLILEILDLPINNSKIVSFYSIGESYLHKDFLPLCEWAIPKLKEKNIKTMIVTNGTHVDFVPKGIDQFIISFNAGTKESYERIYKIKFDKVYNNILKLYRMGEFKKAKSVEIHMLCFEENRGEEKNFKELFKNMKGIKYRFSYKYDNQQEKTDYVGVIKKEKRIPCDYLTNKVIVYPNGDITLCCHDFLNTVSYGNLCDKKLLDILSSEKRMKLLNNHRNLKFDGICEKCNYNVENDCVFIYGKFGVIENIGYKIKEFTKGILKRILNVI